MANDPLHLLLDDVQRVADAGTLPVVVFDLDSTLFDTSGRNLVILQEFAEEYPVVADLVATVRTEELGWLVSSPLRKRGFDDDVVLRALGNFWKNRFFTDDYLLHDLAAPGAPDFANAVHDRGAMVYYLTGRHVGGMERGTAAALLKHGFPYLRGRSSLHLKPNFSMDDTHFKGGAIQAIRGLHGDVLATFENEPGNANLFRRAFPEAVHFLYGNVHSPDAEDPHPELIRIDTFAL